MSTIDEIKRGLHEYQAERMSYRLWGLEILLICLITGASYGFIWGVVTFIVLGILMMLPYVRGLFAIFFTAAWTFLAWGVSKENVEDWTTALGITILVFVFIGGLHLAGMRGNRN